MIHLNQNLPTFISIQLPLSSFVIHSIQASTCSFNPLLVDVPRSLEPSPACSPSLPFYGGLNSSSSSVIHCLKERAKASWCRSEIWNIYFDSIKIVQILFLPLEFDGNILFKLPPTNVATTIVKQLQGMDRNQWPPLVCSENHPHKKNYGLNFKQVVWAGHLCYVVEDFPSLLWDGKPNEVHWKGATNDAFLPKHVFPLHSTIVFKFCKTPVLCVSICDAKIYYVVHKLPHVIRACIHFDMHNHPISSDDYRESIKITKELVRHEVEKNPCNHFGYCFGC